MNLYSCFKKENKSNEQASSTTNDTPKVEKMQHVNNCVYPEFLTMVPYAEGRLKIERKILLYAAQKDALPYEYRSIQPYLENIEHPEYGILSHSSYKLFPGRSTISTLVIKPDSVTEQQTLSMKKVENKVYGEWVELHKYEDDKTDNYNISVYAPKLDSKSLASWIKRTNNKPKDEQESRYASCLNALVVAANVKDRLRYLLDTVVARDTSFIYEYTCSIVESTQYFQATPSGLSSGMGTQINIETESNSIWEIYKTDVPYTIPQLLQKLPDATVYASTEDRNEIIVVWEIQAQPIIKEDRVSPHYSVKKWRYFYFVRK
jgi:hypothetical protein